MRITSLAVAGDRNDILLCSANDTVIMYRVEYIATANSNLHLLLRLVELQRWCSNGSFIYRMSVTKAVIPSLYCDGTVSMQCRVRRLLGLSEDSSELKILTRHNRLNDVLSAQFANKSYRRIIPDVSRNSSSLMEHVPLAIIRLHTLGTGVAFTLLALVRCDTETESESVSSMQLIHIYSVLYISVRCFTYLSNLSY